MRDEVRNRKPMKLKRSQIKFCRCHSKTNFNDSQKIYQNISFHVLTEIAMTTKWSLFLSEEKQQKSFFLTSLWIIGGIDKSNSCLICQNSSGSREQTSQLRGHGFESHCLLDFFSCYILSSVPLQVPCLGIFISCWTPTYAAKSKLSFIGTE